MLPTHDPWYWDPAKCPADQHFLEWIRPYAPGGVILHLGTGAHHRVGIELWQKHLILGLTLSPQEMQSYMNLAWAIPALSRNYRVLFGDIFLTDFALLPKFDFITLFHLGEIRSEEYPALTIEQVLLELKDLLNVEGWMLAYTQSHVADRVIPLMEKHLRHIEDYKTLKVYQV